MVLTQHAAHPAGGPARTRPDLCPGIARPWVADDGALVRLRLVGGALPAASLRALLAVSERWGDGAVHLTSRANLQVRGLPHDDGRLPAEVVSALEATGLLPSRRAELVRNVLLSPLSGLAGGRADLRPVAAALDAGLQGDPALAGLSARTLVVLDDGRGDVVDRACDLGLVALRADRGQLRVGSGWGRVVPLEQAADALLALARALVDARGSGPDAPWHVDELAAPLPGHVPTAPHPDVPAPSGPLPAGPVAGAPGLRHEAVPGGRLDTAYVVGLGLDPDADLVVTPWRGLLVPGSPPTAPPPAPPPASAPPARYDYVRSGRAIYDDSFATIRREARLEHLPADAEKVAVRMVHGTGQTDLVDDLVVHPRLVAAARAALQAGAPILTDAHMVASGVTRARLPRDNEVVCTLRDPRVPALATRWGTTRSAAALGLWGDRLEGAVVAIGNAPTALFHLLEMLLDGAPPPAAVVGCPVGFIGAAESKEALIAFAAEHGLDVPFLTVRGRRGGSAMTASALNALAQEAE